MDLGAFVFLEDISGELPPYEETRLSVPMEPLMRAAWAKQGETISVAICERIEPATSQLKGIQP